MQVYLLKKDIDIKDIKLQVKEIKYAKWLSYNEFIKLLYSDKFCNHVKEYKDWVSQILKEKTTNK